MTYCVAMKLDSGMVFASDSRTNAGIDNISKFGKMCVFARVGQRVIVTLSAGNLSITQSALNLLEQRARSNPDAPGIWNAISLYDIAGLLGEAMREVKNRDGEFLRQNNIDASASFIVGGQIAGETQRLFQVYSEGNFIEASLETPYFQIGEIKYGKPIIDRILTPATDLTEATQCTLVSFDSTMRSNVSVGLPIDLLVYRNNSLNADTQQRIEDGDPYFNQLATRWSEGLRGVFVNLPKPDWLTPKT
jgi:putative proteasome-type protease